MYSFLFIFLHINESFSQVKRVIAIGSSTTAGNGATTIDSSWVRYLNRFYKCQLGIADSVYNLGVPGSDFYRAMPTGYLPPAFRPFPDTVHNISKGRFLLKDIINTADGVIIINYPTNNYNNYSFAEILNSLQLIYDSATSTGNRCFITTTQPRLPDDFEYHTGKLKIFLATTLSNNSR
jgi:hypothetical protein